MCGIDVRRRICLVTIQKAKNEELVGDKSTHEIFAEYKERVIQRRLIYMPLLLLMGWKQENHAVAQFNLAEVQ